MSRAVELVARYGSDEALGVIYDHEKGVSLLPDGGLASSCVDCAEYIRSREPNAAVYGFWTKQNPDWVGRNLHDGHDFAVVDGRYIVDPWLVETERLSARAVFDLQDPNDDAEVRRVYGDQRRWHLAESPVPLPSGP